MTQQRTLIEQQIRTGRALVMLAIAFVIGWGVIFFFVCRQADRTLTSDSRLARVIHGSASGSQGYQGEQACKPTGPTAITCGPVEARK